MNIIGISGFYHDSAACLIKDGEIINAVQEERFTRIKNDHCFPINSIKFCLENNDLTINDIDLFVFYEKPFIKLERILETHLIAAPKGFSLFLKQIPLWFKNKIFFKQIMLQTLSTLGNIKKEHINLFFVPHHFSHAASAFYPSPFDEATIVTIDGVGEWATATVGYGKGKEINIFKQLNYPNSLGLFYSSVTYFLGFKVNSDEYKVMGLAPYGNKKSANYNKIYEKLKSLIKIYDDGSVFLNLQYFNYLYEEKMVNEKKWDQLLGFKKREKDDPIEQHHCNLALAAQHILEESILNITKYAKKIAPSKNLCLAGGVFLNCVANYKILKEGLFENIWIQPAAGDAGGAIGCAYYAYHKFFDAPRVIENGKTDKMRGAYLGPEYDLKDIIKSLKRHRLNFRIFEDFDLLIEAVVNYLLQDFVIGWFQGRLEFGPRALGNRSILADPRKKEMQQIVNLKIKFREGFRPFAPAVLEEDSKKIFDLQIYSPYMLFVGTIKDIFKYPDDGIELYSLKEKINFKSSLFPAVTHLDYTARLQTVNEQTNPKFYKLLKKFKEKTGYGIILNTSFNVKDEPIVCSPDDAINCFLKTGLDMLVMENAMILKNNR